MVKYVFMLQMADEFCFDGLLSPEDDVFLNDILGNPPIQMPDPSLSLPPVPAPQQMMKTSLQCPAGCPELSAAHSMPSGIG